jgi:hypothetical protein
MAKDTDSKVNLKFLNAQLLVKSVKSNAAPLVAHTKALQAGAITKYNLSRVEIKTFTFANGSQSLFIDIAVFGILPKRLLFTLVKNKYFLGSIDTNPFKFRHYDIRHFALYVNGKQIPSEGLHQDTGREKKTVMGYRTLLKAPGIRHSNMGLPITHDMYIAGYFMLLFDLTTDHGVAEGHTSNPESGHIRIEAHFKKALPDVVTCLIYLKYDNCVHIDLKRTVTIDLS